MIKKYVSKIFNEQAHSIKSIHDEMAKEAIKDDGIYSTFKFHNHWLPAQGLTKAKLRYCKLGCDDKWLPAQRKIYYKDYPELGDVTLPYIRGDIQQKVTDRLMMDMVKKDDAIWSTINIQACWDHFLVKYDKANNLEAEEDPHLTTSRYLGASDLEIENTKKTLQRLERLRENSYYGLYPRNAGLTYAFEKLKVKEDIKDSLVYGLWESRVKKDTKEKEKTDMNVTLMIVPEGMNKDFVKRVKARLQSDTIVRLYVASTDIDFSEYNGRIKTKYDLFEDWVTTGKVDKIYFMIGFEKDPVARAFESFVRGIEESGKINAVHIIYQKDDLDNDISCLKNAYSDEADAKEDFEKAGNRVVKEAKTMKEVYSLDDTGLDIVKYSKENELIMGKIMEAAFASHPLDDAAKPAKKGGTK